MGYVTHRRGGRGLAASVSLLALCLGAAAAYAAPQSIGSVEVDSGPKASAPGTAAAVAPSQASLESCQPGSIVSDQVIQDIASPAADYNESLKFTPNFVTTNANGALGDTKAAWRGFQDGQYNITFDGIPFGDFNDPTHHSNAYFPGAFISREVIDRGPGRASQPGYATFGGTLSLLSYDISDTPGGSLSGSLGTWGTGTATTTLQSGLLDKNGTKFVIQFDHEQSNGALTLANVHSNYFVGKIQHQFGDFTGTLFSSVGYEHYNNANPITMLQWNLYGKSYAQLNNDPRTQQFVGYNNSVKQTDMEYFDLKGSEWGWKFDNKAYTYSYWYPAVQNNGNDQTIEGVSSLANGGTVNSFTVKSWFPTQGIATAGTKVSFPTVGANDVTGYIKYNNYRAYGDLFDASRSFDAGIASGTLKTGFWYEYASNDRLQEYFDYTQGVAYPALPFTVSGTNNQAVLNAASYKLNLNSKTFNFQPYIEYEWKPTDRLTVTPGFKYESFTRNLNAIVNQTTLIPASFSATYTAALPFLDIRYRLTDEITVYGQAAKGFLAPTVSAYYVVNQANANIAPENTTNYQLGGVFKNDRISFDADIYRLTATNFPVTSTLPDGSTQYLNAGTARYQGIEAEGTYVLWPKGLSVYAAGAVSQAKYISGPNTGLSVGDAPKYTFAGGLIYDDGHFFGSALHKINGDMFGSAGECGYSGSKAPASCATGAAALNKVPSYNETDLVIGYRTEMNPKTSFFKKAELRLGVNDLFDNRNVVEISGDPTATGVTTPGGKAVAGGALAYSFQPGRYVYGQVKLDF